MENLAELKKEYEKVRKGYNLPPFSELNIEFEIEKLQERDTEFLIKGVRRTMLEKVAVILRFFELIVNPNEATPIFVFSITKGLSNETKKKIESTYKELTLIEIASLNLDIDYNEKEEAKFIKGLWERWPEIKKNLKEVTNKIEVVWGHHEKKHDNYFG